MYVNFLSTYSDKKSCHTSTTLQTSIERFVSDSWAFCNVIQAIAIEFNEGLLCINAYHCYVSMQTKSFEYLPALTAKGCSLKWNVQVAFSMSEVKTLELTISQTLNAVCMFLLYAGLRYCQSLMENQSQNEWMFCTEKIPLQWVF